MSPSKAFLLVLLGILLVQCHAAVDSVEDEATYKGSRVLGEAVDKLNKKIKNVANGMTKRMSSYVEAIEKGLTFSTESIENTIKYLKENMVQAQKNAEEHGKNVTDCVENFGPKLDKILEDLKSDVRNCTSFEAVETVINQARTGLPNVKTTGQALLGYGVDVFVGIGTQLTGAITTCLGTLTELAAETSYCYFDFERPAEHQLYDIHNTAADCINDKYE